MTPNKKMCEKKLVVHTPPLAEIIWEGNCGLWVRNEMIKEIYPENLQKLVSAVWGLPAK